MSRTSWREGVALAVAVVTAGMTLWHLPAQLRGFWADARNGAVKSREERLLAPAEARGIKHRHVFEAATRIIPPDEAFTVILGPDAERAEPGVRSAVAFASNWLLPRRHVGYEAPWALYYGFQPESAPIRARRTTRLAAGVYLIRAAA